MLDTIKQAAKKAKYTAKSALFLKNVVFLIQNCPKEMRKIHHWKTLLDSYGHASQKELAEIGNNVLRKNFCKGCQNKLNKLQEEIEADLKND